MNHTLKINLTVASKTFFMLYIVYSNVTSYSLFFIKGLSSLLLLGALALQLIHNGFRLRHNNSLLALVFFTAYVFFSGIFISKNFDIVKISSFNLIAYIVCFYLVLQYIREDRKPDFVMWVFIIQAILAVILMVFRGTDAQRVSISENVNTNVLGTMFVLAIGFVLFILISKENNPRRIIVGIGTLLLLLFGIMMTGSKKGIIFGASIILLWIVLCYKTFFKSIKPGFKILLLLGLIALTIFIYKWYTEYYYYRIEYIRFRMSQLYTGNSDQKRLELFKEGFSIFLSHPIFGVGLNNARYYTPYNTYTHNFYSELFSCTGFFGVILFGYALFCPWAELVKLQKAGIQRDVFQRKQTTYMMVIFLILLGLGIAQIIFYTSCMMYAFAVITGYASSAYEDPLRLK